MAKDTSGTCGKVFEVKQIGSTYRSAIIRVSYKIGKYYFDLTNNGMVIKLDNMVLNNERTSPFKITRNATIPSSSTFYGWNRKYNNTVGYSNTNRVLVPVAQIYPSYIWSPSSGTQKDTYGTKYLSASSDVRLALVNEDTYSEDIEYFIGVGSSRSNSKTIRVHMDYANGAARDHNYMGNVSLKINTSQIPAPSSPTITSEYRNYVDDEPTVLRLRATVPTNVEGFFTLVIEDITSGVKILKSSKGGTNIYVDIPLNEAYYDKTWKYRARIYGADIDKRSSTLSIFVEFPILPIWYYLTQTDKTRLGVSHTRMQVKKAVWYDNNGNAKGIKLFAYNNGGSFEK